MAPRPAILLTHADLLLRAAGAGGRAVRELRARDLVALIVAFGLLHGALIGTFGLFAGEPRFLQIAYSAVKVPLLLLATFAIALPSFFVLNTILGLRADFGAVLRSLFASQAALTVVLSSLGPLVVVFYAGTDNYPAATLFNAIPFALASFAAQHVLRELYRPLVARNARHRTMLVAWIVIYAFVGIQMGWVLRPFIGDPRLPTQFFRENAWSNAYVAIAKIAGGMFTAPHGR